jgi:hypothetical protein
MCVKIFFPNALGRSGLSTSEFGLRRSTSAVSRAASAFLAAAAVTSHQMLFDCDVPDLHLLVGEVLRNRGKLRGQAGVALVGGRDQLR